MSCPGPMTGAQLALLSDRLPFSLLQTNVSRGREDGDLDDIIAMLAAYLKTLRAAGIHGAGTIVTRETLSICLSRRQWLEADDAGRRSIEWGLVPPPPLESAY